MLDDPSGLVEITSQTRSLSAGGITTVHLPPFDIAVVNAVRAAELGATMIEHHYGYAKAALANRAMSLPWHERATHAVLIDWFALRSWVFIEIES